jgi:hypothetical protein
MKIFPHILAALLLVAPSFAQSSPDSPRQSSNAFEALDVTDTSIAGSGGTATSEQFYLGKSEYFSIETLVTTTGTANYDLIAQFKGMDGTWRDDPDGDIVTANSNAWDLVTLSLDYYTNPIRLKLTNDDTSYIDARIVVHRNPKN